MRTRMRRRTGKRARRHRRTGVHVHTVSARASARLETVGSCQRSPPRRALMWPHENVGGLALCAPARSENGQRMGACACPLALTALVIFTVGRVMLLTVVRRNISAVLARLRGLLFAARAAAALWCALTYARERRSYSIFAVVCCIPAAINYGLLYEFNHRVQDRDSELSSRRVNH